jgi:hypothetical protein
VFVEVKIDVSLALSDLLPVDCPDDTYKKLQCHPEICSDVIGKQLQGLAHQRMAGTQLVADFV